MALCNWFPKFVETSGTIYPKTRHHIQNTLIPKDNLGQKTLFSNGVEELDIENQTYVLYPYMRELQKN